MGYDYVDFNTVLIDKIFTNIEVIEDEEIIFTTDTDEKYKMYHYWECCEQVTIDEIHGDLNDLIGSPILLAEEVSNIREEKNGDTFTWTFYKLSTIKGSVTIKWYGTSNGYYSEGVDFVLLNDVQEPIIKRPRVEFIGNIS